MESMHEKYVNKPLFFHMPTKLKHFTQPAKNTQFSFFFLCVLLLFYYPPCSELTMKLEAEGGRGHPGT